MESLIISGGIVVGSWMVLIFAYRSTLMSLWREPVFSCPVLIIESDDWGPGPPQHAAAINRLMEVLLCYRDTAGRPPVITLGVVLAVPDTTRMRENGKLSYHRVTLADDCFQHIRGAMQRGVEAGVFALQLHGMEHYWPESVLDVAERDLDVRAWLIQNEVPISEDLPARLQSRWTDASRLPSCPIPDTQVRDAAAGEVGKFEEVFGYRPAVAVPPTFVWNSAVEEAWAAAGIGFIVTPGYCFDRRDRNGKPVPKGSAIHNGGKAAGGATYIVRNEYFEPRFGHTAEKGLQALVKNVRLGRPTLLETHRLNFISDGRTLEKSIAEIDRLLDSALDRHPELRFMSTEELGEAMLRRDPELIETRFGARLHVWLLRLMETRRLVKLAWLTGLILPACLLFQVTRRNKYRGS